MTRYMINLFTHNDLDGVSCSVISHLFAKENGCMITVKYCDRGKNKGENINSCVNALLDTIDIAREEGIALPDRRLILITDISVNEETARRLDRYRCQSIEIASLDHHSMQHDVVKREWMIIDLSPDTCAVKMLYRFLCSGSTFLSGMKLRGTLSADRYVDDVCQYDTWNFSEGDNAYYLNVLLGALGKEAYQAFITGWLSERRLMLAMNTCFAPILEQRDRERKEYCGRRSKPVLTIEYDGHQIGIVFAEKYLSQVGHTLLNKNPNVDIAAVVCMPSSVSLRTKRKDIDLSRIATKLGGGGRAEAAAYTLPHIDGETLRKITSL